MDTESPAGPEGSTPSAPASDLAAAVDSLGPLDFKAEVPDYEEPAVRPTSPSAAEYGIITPEELEKQTKFDQHTKDAMLQGRIVLRRLSLFETQDSFILVGSNRSGKFFKILKFERSMKDRIVIEEEPKLFTARETRKYLSTLHSVVAATGGVRLKLKAEAFLGMIKFYNVSYLLLVTQKKPVGIIAGRHVYKIAGVEMVALTPNLKTKPKTDAEEKKYKQYFQQVDMTEDFYFSYSYDVTNTLQGNVVKFKKEKRMFFGDADAKKPEESKDSASASAIPPSDSKESSSKGPFTMEEKLEGERKSYYNEKYLWNYYWIQEFLASCDRSYWIVPLIHGFFEQRTVRIAHNVLNVTVIARRSRHHAGTRYNKRGINAYAHAANEVETEQILSLNKPWIDGRGQFTSFVMIRGSIPLFWKQQNPWAPKPDITIYKTEPDYYTSRAHFNRLFEYYGGPIVCFNLIKKVEKRPQEVIVGKEFEKAIAHISDYYRSDEKSKETCLLYMTYDFLSELKAKNDVTNDLYKLAMNFSDSTSWFFHNEFPQEFQSVPEESVKRLQHGIVRVNCVDCLDRTNIAMFCLGLAVFGHQLLDLKIIHEFEKWELRYGALAEILQNMYTRHGDRIAQQYGGSGTMHKAALDSAAASSAGKVGNALTAIKRYYSNNFLDAEKQYSINVFLGAYIPSGEKRAHVWDSETEKVFTDADKLYPVDIHKIQIPYIPSPPTGDPFLAYFDELYDPTSVTFFDSTLEAPHFIPIVLSGHHRRDSMEDIAKKFVTALDPSTAELAPESTLDSEEVSSLKSIPVSLTSSTDRRTISFPELDSSPRREPLPSSMGLPTTYELESDKESEFGILSGLPLTEPERKPSAILFYDFPPDASRSDPLVQEYASYLDVEKFGKIGSSVEIPPFEKKTSAPRKDSDSRFLETAVFRDILLQLQDMRSTIDSRFAAIEAVLKENSAKKASDSELK